MTDRKPIQIDVQHIDRDTALLSRSTLLALVADLEKLDQIREWAKEREDAGGVYLSGNPFDDWTKGFNYAQDRIREMLQ